MTQEEEVLLTIAKKYVDGKISVKEFVHKVAFYGMKNAKVLIEQQKNHGEAAGDY
jgi:hypothetical protein